MDLTGVAAVVLHFRAIERTLECIDSLRAERIGHLVLVDNSEDGGESLAIMRAQLDELNASGMSTELVTPDRNLGFAKGVNAGLMRAVGAGVSGILLINSDACLECGALSSLVRGLGDAAAAVPATRSRSDAPTSSPFLFYQRVFALVFRERWAGCLRYPSGCFLVLRVDVAKPPLFDEDFFFYGEDVMLGRDFQARGMRIVECPDAVIVHSGSGSAKNGSMFYEYHINRGHWLLASKLASNLFELAGCIACRCIILPLRALVRSLRFRSLTPWRGLLAATFDVMRGRCRSFTPPAT